MLFAPVFFIITLVLIFHRSVDAERVADLIATVTSAILLGIGVLCGVVAFCGQKKVTRNLFGQCEPQRDKRYAVREPLPNGSDIIHRDILNHACPVSDESAFIVSREETGGLL